VAKNIKECSDYNQQLDVNCVISSSIARQQTTGQQTTIKLPNVTYNYITNKGTISAHKRYKERIVLHAVYYQQPIREQNCREAKGKAN